jgi:hypothetical protein
MLERMDNTIVYLLGHYGVGKLTVAKALCALTGARLVDNHLINNVVFGVIGADGKTPLPPETWELTARVGEIAFEAIETIAAPATSYVLTNALTDEPRDRAYYARVVTLVDRRGALFVPVVVTCDETENALRIPSPERARNMKHTDAPSAMERRRTIAPLPIIHPNRFDLDTTRQSPDDAAKAILAHIRTLS